MRQAGETWERVSLAKDLVLQQIKSLEEYKNKEKSVPRSFSEVEAGNKFEKISI